MQYLFCKNVIVKLFSDHDNFYHGRVFGEIDSHAQIHIDDGVLTGTVTVPDETFHIEVKKFS